MSANKFALVVVAMVLFFCWTACQEKPEVIEIPTMPGYYIISAYPQSVSACCVELDFDKDGRGRNVWYGNPNDEARLRERIGKKTYLMMIDGNMVNRVFDNFDSVDAYLRRLKAIQTPFSNDKRAYFFNL